MLDTHAVIADRRLDRIDQQAKGRRQQPHLHRDNGDNTEMDQVEPHRGRDRRPNTRRADTAKSLMVIAAFDAPTLGARSFALCHRALT